MEVMKKIDTGKHDSRTASFRIACIVSKIWLRQVEEKKHDNSYDLQIDGPAQFLIFINFAYISQNKARTR